jgi:hypothetical protein
MGKRTWRPERVVLIVGAGDGVSEGAVAGVAMTTGCSAEVRVR